MKSLLKTLLINAGGLFVLAYLIPAFRVTGGLRTYVIASIALALLNLFVRPLLNLLLLPVNLLTLGFFRWVTNAVILWILTIFVPQISIFPFNFPGFSYQEIVLPEITLSVTWTTIVSAFLFSLITTFLDWIIDR